MLTLPLVLSLQALAAEAAHGGAPRAAAPADTVFRSALVAATGLGRQARPDTTPRPLVQWPDTTSRDRVLALADLGRVYVPTPNPCPRYPMPMFWPADTARYQIRVVKPPKQQPSRMPVVTPNGCSVPPAADSATGR